MLAAQGYQESRLDQSVKSPVGAIGVMQVMPATGAELKVGDIRETENNIHAGTKYLRTLIDRYFRSVPSALASRDRPPAADRNAPRSRDSRRPGRLPRAFPRTRPPCPGAS